MNLYVATHHRFSFIGRRAAFLIALTLFLNGCGTLICMDGPCDAVVASIYSKSLFTPNAFSESRSSEEMADDIWECKRAGEAEQNRLVAELQDFDPYLKEYAARRAKIEGKGQSAGRFVAKTDVNTSGSGVRVSGGGSSTELERDVLGALGSMATSVFMDDGYDPNKQPLMDLEDYLQEGDTFVRFTNTCLRQKGYQISENSGDGYGVASVNPELLTVTIRRSDCMDITLYKKSPLRDPAPLPVENCDPAALQLAAGIGALTWPNTDLPEPLAGINTRKSLNNYLEVDPACVWSRPGYEVCSWREIGKRNMLYMRGKAYKALSSHIDTDELVNVVCELPQDGSISTPNSCQIYPRESKGEPNMKNGASDAALASIHTLNGVGAMSRMVGDGPLSCKTVGEGIQECGWYLDKEVQGFKLAGTIANTEKPVDLACRFSLDDGASLPGGCSAARAR